MAWRRLGDKPLFEPMMVSLLTHICVTRPKWVSLWFSVNSQLVSLNILYLWVKFDGNSSSLFKTKLSDCFIILHSCAIMVTVVMGSRELSIGKKMNLTKTVSSQFNSLWPCDAIYHHTLVQMGCCLMAPTNYLIQCLLIISEVKHQQTPRAV